MPTMISKEERLTIRLQNMFKTVSWFASVYHPTILPSGKWTGLLLPRRISLS